MSDVIIYGLTIVAVIITTLAQAFITAAYKKYSEVKNTKEMSGAETARKILDANGLNTVKVLEVDGYLTDHYDPSEKVVRLSSTNYNGKSIAGLSVAAHECGHAIQDKENFAFLRLRASMVPLVNFSSYAGYLAIAIGCLTGIMGIVKIGILLECVILLFQVVTLPVEIDASRRALKEVKKYNYLSSSELNNGRAVLIAAALTYVASVASTLLQIVKLLFMFRKDEK